MGYWGRYEYYAPARPKRVKNGIKTKSQRGKIGETWWSGRWVEYLESLGMGARLGRGRSYARRGQVISVRVGVGKVTAKVQGTRSKPYDVTVGLKPISDKNWDRITDAMASRAVFAAKLLAGEMPRNIEEAFDEAGVPLFPAARGDLKSDCSCPDWANPCKHIAAVYYILAERFDDDPFLIFKLRGRTGDQIVSALREKRLAKPSEGDDPVPMETGPEPECEVRPLNECLDTFWVSGEGLESFRARPRAPEVDKAVLIRLGNGPCTVRGQNISVVLEKAYEAAGKAALKRALEE